MTKAQSFQSMLLRVVLVLGGALLGSGAEARFVRYSLSPNEAERVLAGLSERPRLLDDKWLDLVGARAAEGYQVRAGDNLWGISRKLFGNGFYWSKLWEENPQLTNPHELEKGTRLSLYREPNRDLASEGAALPSEIRIPLIKLLPERKGVGADIDQDAVVNLDIKNRYQPRFVVLTPDDPIFGSITGSFNDGEVLTQNHYVYIKAQNKDLVVGERYAVVHEEKSLRDRTQDGSPLIGNLVQVVGTVVIREVGEKLLKAELVDMSGIVMRGDKIIHPLPPVNWSMRFDPPGELQCRILMGDESDNKLFVQGQLVLLNKGTVDGMKPGYTFRVWRDSDLFTENELDVEPESKGEVQIVHANTLSSIGFIVRNVEPLRIGDTLIPRQAFSNPPRPDIRRVREPYEIP